MVSMQQSHSMRDAFTPKGKTRGTDLDSPSEVQSSENEKLFV